MSGVGALPCRPSHEQGPPRLTRTCSPSRPDAAIDPWLHDLWEKVLALYPVPLDLGVIPAGVP